MNAEMMAARAGAVVSAHDPHAAWRRAKRHRAAVAEWERRQERERECVEASEHGLRGARMAQRAAAIEDGRRRGRADAEVLLRTGSGMSTLAAIRSEGKYDYIELDGGRVLSVGGIEVRNG